MLPQKQKSLSFQNPRRAELCRFILSIIRGKAGCVGGWARKPTTKGKHFKMKPPKGSSNREKEGETFNVLFILTKGKRKFTKK